MSGAADVGAVEFEEDDIGNLDPDMSAGWMVVFGFNGANIDIGVYS